ncbi:MAG: general secretion pathway protein C [Flavobacteriales bacterium]
MWAEKQVTNKIDQQLQTSFEYLKRLPLSFWRNLFIAIALIWLVRSLASLFWVVVPSPDVSVSGEWIPAKPVTSAAALGAAVNIDALLAQNVFGDAGAEVMAAPEVVEVRPEEIEAETTKLDLKLVGVMVSSILTKSAATIARGSDQDLYSINDKMPVGNNVVLAKILSDRVILDNNGNYESLWLYTESDFKITANAAPSRPVRPTNRKSEPPAKRPEGGADESRRDATQAKIKPSEVPEAISDIVRFSVHREEGQMVGFRIRPGKNRELFDRIGLKTNDVVTAVNGVPIDNAQAIRDNYQELKNATSADLEIRRGEETIYINVSIDTSE